MLDASLRQVSLPTGTIAYRRAGSGPPVVLLHGWGGSSRHWEDACAALSSQFTLYALDLPGFGDSPPSEGMVTVGRLADQVIAFADRLGLQRFALVGHSFGAGVAVAIASQLPLRVNRLVLVSFGLPRSMPEQCMVLSLHAQLVTIAALWRPWFMLWRPWFATARPLLTTLWSAPPLATLLAAGYMRQIPDQASRQQGIADFIRADPATALDGSASIGDPLVQIAAGQLDLPTLVVIGRGDPVMPATSGVALAASLPDCRLALLDDCGHIPMVEQPRAFCQVLESFLVPGASRSADYVRCSA